MLSKFVILSDFPDCALLHKVLVLVSLFEVEDDECCSDKSFAGFALRPEGLELEGLEASIFKVEVDDECSDEIFTGVLKKKIKLYIK